MKTRITILAAMLTASCIAQELSAQNKPVRKFEAHTYWVAPPQTLAGMINAADAVVRVKFLGNTVTDSGKGVVSVNHFQVLEILHTLGGFSVDPDQITVERRDGDIDRGSYVERHSDEDFPAFQPNHEYIVFLKHQADRATWIPSWGPSSVFDLTTGVVESAKLSKVTRDQENIPAPVFLQLIRHFGR